MSSKKLPASLKSETPFLPPTQEEDLSKIGLMDLVDRMSYVGRKGMQVVRESGNGERFRETMAKGMNDVACGRNPRK